MSANLYLEIDDDITSAIEKLVKSPANEVAVVVPKRSTLLQSIVNLKLLKKAADDSGKRLILVTGDKTAMHLASRVGLAVATSVQAEAQVPETDMEEPEPTSEIIEGGETTGAAGGAAKTPPPAMTPK